MTMRSVGRPGAPFAIPRVTTPERDALALGNLRANESMVVYNTTTTQVEAWNGAAWVAVGSGGRTALTEDTTFYVDADSGDDSNDGTLGSPFLTPQAAVDFIRRDVDFAGYACSLQLNDAVASYAPFTVAGSFVGQNSNFVVQGESEANVKVAGGAGVQIITASHDARVLIRDLTVEAQGDGAVAFYAANGGKLTMFGDATITEDSARVGCNGFLLDRGGEVRFLGATPTLTVDSVQLDTLVWGRWWGRVLFESAWGIAHVGSIAYAFSGYYLQNMSEIVYNVAPTVSGTNTGKRWTLEGLSFLKYTNLVNVPGSTAGDQASGSEASAT